MTIRVRNLRLNLAGLSVVLKSSGVQAMTDQAAQDIASRAGENFHAKSVPHRYTSRSYATWSNAAGYREEAKKGQLSKAFGGAVNG